MFVTLATVTVLLAVQTPSASITGTVLEEGSGAPVPGAVVILADLDRAETTDSSGRYTFRDVPPGPQHVAVRLLGYAPRTLHALVPRQGGVVINIALRPEAVELPAIAARHRIPVRGVETDETTSFPDRGLTAAAVRLHPQLAEPDFFQAIAGGEVVIRPEAPSGIHIRGGASDQTAFLLDGIPVFSPYHTAGTFSAWNPDALARLDLAVAPPAAGFTDALSGVVSGVTRTPGTGFHTQGSLSSTQARVTVDGPLGGGGAGYLVSLRTGYPGVLRHRNDAGYLRGDTRDVLAKVESPLLGGRLRVMGYDSDNAIDVSVSGAEEQPDASGPRNGFSWRSRSIGGTWERPAGGATLSVSAWRATAGAGADWRDEAGEPERLTADRRDAGAGVSLKHRRADRVTIAGVQARRSRTAYDLTAGLADSTVFALRGRTPVTAAFLHHGRPVAPRVRVELGIVGAWAEDRVRFNPSAQLRWEPRSAVALSATYARTHQLAQSLRNPESVVSNIFPVDLYIGSGAPGVPVGRSDQGILAAEVHPVAGLRLDAQVYGRDFDGLLLVAPTNADPYASGGFATGSGHTWGGVLGAAFSAERYGVLASYGYQDLALSYGDTTFVPDQGAAHLLDTGVIYFPSVTSSVNVGIATVIGRRTTAVGGLLKYEACNLLDQGCEFAGSPQTRLEPLGATSVPAYVRLDLGVRKHWHWRVAGRNGLLTAFGTLTNVLGRSNVLTYVDDPATDARSTITMRPRAPLVVGLDWDF